MLSWYLKVVNKRQASSKIIQSEKEGKRFFTTIQPQARNQGGARGAFAPPSPTGPKGPHFDTQYPS